MAKRFSYIQIGEDIVLAKGFKTVKSLMNLSSISKILEGYSVLDNVHIRVNHCLFMDYPSPIEDISDKELETLGSVFMQAIQDNLIYLEKYIDLDVHGLQEDEIIES